MNKLRLLTFTLVAATTLTVISSCGGKRSTGWEYARNMYDPIAYNPDQPNENFANKQSAQLPPDGTTPLGYDRVMEKYPNTIDGYRTAGESLTNPLPASKATLEEGKLLYLHMCSHCHGETGNGDGSIIKLEKFPPPPSYSTGNSSRGGAMKDLTDGKIFHTITYGVNLMGPHNTQLSPTERWKIVMYVHELQKAQF